MADIGETLKSAMGRKVGGVPFPAIVAAVAVAAYGYSVYRKRKSAATATSQAVQDANATATGDTGAATDQPLFFAQNPGIQATSSPASLTPPR